MLARMGVSVLCDVTVVTVWPQVRPCTLAALWTLAQPRYTHHHASLSSGELSWSQPADIVTNITVSHMH